MRATAGHLGMKKGIFCAVKCLTFKIESSFDQWYFFMYRNAVVV